MSRKNAKRPPPSFATSSPNWHMHFVPMFDDQIRSPAYVALSKPARDLYLVIRSQYKGDYTGPKVTAPYSFLEEMGFRTNTASKALLELECFGFIKIEHGGLGHVPSVYHLISDWQEIKTTLDVEEAKNKFRSEIEKRKLAAERKKTFS